MSLDVYLRTKRPPEAIDQSDPEGSQYEEHFSASITHNLGKMAAEVNLVPIPPFKPTTGVIVTLYQTLWRPEEIGLVYARDLAPLLEQGIAFLQADPEKYKALEPENKWGTYKDFIPWLQKYLSACKRYPDAEIGISR